MPTFNCFWWKFLSNFSKRRVALKTASKMFSGDTLCHSHRAAARHQLPFCEILCWRKRKNKKGWIGWEKWKWCGSKKDWKMILRETRKEGCGEAGEDKEIYCEQGNRETKWRENIFYLHLCLSLSFFYRVIFFFFARMYSFMIVSMYVCTCIYTCTHVIWIPGNNKQQLTTSGAAIRREEMLPQRLQLIARIYGFMSATTGASWLASQHWPDTSPTPTTVTPTIAPG